MAFKFELHASGIVIGRLSKQQQAIRRGRSLTPQTFALLPEMACCCFESRPMTMPLACHSNLKAMNSDR